MGIFKGPNITTRANKISSFTVATAEYGAPVMEILGTTRISGNVIYYDDFTAHEHRETHRTGKGGGGGKQTTITYTYTVALIIGLCEGVIKNIGKVWIDKELYTYPHENIGMTLFNGTENQAPWGYLLSKHPDKALAYPGLAYMAGVVDLGDNASMPNFNFEAVGKLTETGDGVDVNPADYIQYVLDRVGMGDVEIEGLDNYRAYCKAANLLISTPNDDTDTKAARDIVNEIAELSNAYMFWSNDRFKIVPREDRQVGTWKPNREIMYDLTPDDFLPQSGACISYSRKDSSELYNRFTVEFLNRANGYEKESVSYEDAEDIANYGVKQASTINAHYIYTKARAVMLAEAAARKNKYERNKYTFKLGWAFCRLEPGDLVTLTDPELGLDKIPVMIDSLTESVTGELTITAIGRPPGEYGKAKYDVHETERPFIDFNLDPGFIAQPAIFQPDSSLMYGNNEVWIGAHGQSPYWGGCNVWASNNDRGYKLIGTINQAARIGTIVNGMTVYDTAVEVTLNDQLVSGEPDDAENGNTLLWLDGESMSYTTATLLENGNYYLDGLVRGQYNTDAVAHDAGTQITRCDDALIRANFLDSDIGKLIYFKFTSYNVLNANEQSLADVPAYTYVIQARDAYPPDVTAIDCVKLSTGTRQFWWDFTYPEPNDIAGFELRYNQGTNITWDTAMRLHTGLITEQPFETEALRQGVHTVMIKAVDNSGYYSRGMASVILDLGDPLEENVLFKGDAKAENWAQTVNNGNADDGNIVSNSNVAFWNDTTSPMWLALDSQYWSERYQTFALSYQVQALASGQMWLQYDLEGPAKIEYRIVGKGTYWDTQDTPYWDGTEDWAGWVDKSEMLKPYTGRSEVKAGDIIQVRITAPNNVLEPTILRDLVVVIDVPDRQEHFENIEVPLAGLKLPIKTPNYYTTAVRVDAVQNSNVAVARAAVITRNPCVIKLVDINNEPVTATVDVTWQGFIKEVI